MNNQMHIKGSIILTLFAAFMIIAVQLPRPVFAGQNVPVTVDIKVTYIVEGNAGTAGGDRFTLAAEDPRTPMPDGSIACKKAITIRDEGSFGFGDIRYESPGVYWYTVTRAVTEKKGVIKDGSVYRAKVIALNDGHGYVLVYKDDSDEKYELVYMDRVAPATGDDNRILLYSGIAVAAAAVLAVFAVRAGRERKKEVHNEAEKTIR